MSWTDERVTLLKKLWTEGRTAAEIAKELGGVTRNAVIGKAHRLKLSNRVSPIQQNNKKPVVAKSIERKIEKPVMVLPPVKPVETRKQRDADSLFSLLDLKPRMCRWPVGDPHDEEFGFCGEEVILGLPYCCEHAKTAYQAATRNKILQAENAMAMIDPKPDVLKAYDKEGKKAAG
ncbi:MAG: gcrA cell cycle regulator family protein [Alphaproteobacteria bacterium]|nr:gcrA cell cycle regulator family protein [Alphaproteobacteria bacterium]